MELADGTLERSMTDDSWVWNNSPLLKADLLQGETYDAREEVPGWNEPGLDLTDWHSVVRINRMETPPEIVEPHPGVPVREIDLLPANQFMKLMAITSLIWGKNMVGVVATQG